MKIIIAAALLVAPVAAEAASFDYLGRFVLSLDAANVVGPAGDATVSPFNNSDSDFGANGNAAATASANSILSGAVATAEISGSGSASGAPFGSAFAKGFSLFDLEITNGSSTESVFLPFILDYQISASALGGGAFSEAFANIGGLVTYGPNSEFTAFDDTLSLSTTTGDMTDLLSGSFGFTLEIAPGDFAFIAASLDAEGSALDTSVNVAPVPLPAGLPLLVGGLGALALLRRRSTV